MFKPVYKITIGPVNIDSTQPESIGSAVAITTSSYINASAGMAAVMLAQTKEQKFQKGDTVSIELGYAEQTTTVMQGTIVNIKPNIKTLLVIAHTPVQALLDLRINQTYENQTAGALVSDLAGQAGLDTQTVEDGIEFPFYVMDDRKNGWEHLHEIAGKCGFDLFLTPDNKLIFKGFKKSSAAHTLIYGENIISLTHLDKQEDFKNVVVRGESPASSRGSDTAHWLTKSFEDFKGCTGTENPVLSIQDPTLRTKEAADKSAKGRKNMIQRKKNQGTTDIIGNANIKLDDIIEIKEAPQSYLNGLFQVRAVSHTLDKQTGFKTRLHFWGIG
jgi:phage protein D